MNLVLIEKYFSAEDYKNAELTLELLNRGMSIKFAREAWASRVVASLWSKSVEKLDPRILLHEWKFLTCQVQVHEVITPCDLCGHPETIYRFELENIINGQKHECGSSCVCYFLTTCNYVAGDEHDIMAVNSDMQKSIRNYQEAERIKKLNLQVSDSNLYDDFKTSILELNESKNPKLTPKQTKVLISFGIDSSLIKVKLSMKYMRDAIESIDVIEPALTNEQVARVRREISKISKKIITC